jgi:hypothetical protein
MYRRKGIAYCPVIQQAVNKLKLVRNKEVTHSRNNMQLFIPGSQVRSGVEVPLKSNSE